MAKQGSWVAKFVALLFAKTALWVRIQTSLLKRQNGRHKQSNSQHTLAAKKIFFKNLFLKPMVSAIC